MYTMSPTGAALAGGIIGGMLITLSIVSLVMYILYVIACWKIFVKAGEKGWKSLIPIYNVYIFYKIVGMTKWFWAIIIASFCVSLITSLLSRGTNPQTFDFSTTVGAFSAAMTIILGVFAFFVSVMFCLRTSRAFGHGRWFAVGLFFLQFIFLLILAFGRSKYNKKVVSSWK